MTATAGAAELADRIRNAYADAALQQARFGDGRRHRPFPNPAKTGAGRFPGPTIPVPAGPLLLVSALLPRLRPPPALSDVPAFTTGSHITAPPAASVCRQSRSAIPAALAASTGTPSIPTSSNSSSGGATKPTRATDAAQPQAGLAEHRQSAHFAGIKPSAIAVRNSPPSRGVSAGPQHLGIPQRPRRRARLLRRVLRNFGRIPDRTLAVPTRRTLPRLKVIPDRTAGLPHRPQGRIRCRRQQLNPAPP